MIGIYNCLGKEVAVGGWLSEAKVQYGRRRQVEGGGDIEIGGGREVSGGSKGGGGSERGGFIAEARQLTQTTLIYFFISI